MKKTKKTACFALIAFVVAALPAVAGDLIRVEKEKRYAEATDDTAVVYVIRPAFMGKAVKMWAFFDDQPIGANKGKQYSFALVPPGKHVFWAKAENVSALELEIEAGKTYYLKQKVKMGGMKARVKLTRIEEAEGVEAIEKCKFSQLTEEGQARAREIVAAKQETAVRKAAMEG